MDFDYVEYDGINQKLIASGTEFMITDSETQEWLRQCQRDKRWEDMASFAGVYDRYPDLTVSQFESGNITHFNSHSEAMYHLLEMIGVSPMAVETVLGLIGNPQVVVDHAKSNLKIDLINQRSLFKIM